PSAPTCASHLFSLFQRSRGLRASPSFPTRRSSDLVQHRVLARDGKAQTGTAGMALAGGIGTPEAVENQFLLAFFQPHTRVRDGHGNSGFGMPDIDGDRVAF